MFFQFHLTFAAPKFSLREVIVKLKSFKFLNNLQIYSRTFNTFASLKNIRKNPLATLNQLMDFIKFYSSNNQSTMWTIGMPFCSPTSIRLAVINVFL